jgi:hypothetical protein
MSMLDDDLAAIHADALALGMADTVTYTTLAGAASSIVGTFSEMPEPFIHAEGAEVHRRVCQFEFRLANVAIPMKGDTVLSASGAYAGTWTVVDTGAGDSAGWVVTVRLDDRTKMGTGRRLP